MLVNKATCESIWSWSLRLSWSFANVWSSSFHGIITLSKMKRIFITQSQINIKMCPGVLSSSLISNTKHAIGKILVFFFLIFSFQMIQQIASNFESTSKQFYSPSCLHLYVLVLFTVVVVTTVDAIVAVIPTSFRYELKSYKVDARIWLLRFEKGNRLSIPNSLISSSTCTLSPFCISFFHTSQQYK